MRAQFTQNSIDSEKSLGDALVEMVERTQATIEFDTSGTILRANENFLATLGYSMNEIVGEHHRMFVSSDFANSEEYASFWDTLRAGKQMSGQFERISKSGAKVWIQATYAPVFDAHGTVSKVIKLATDITPRHEAVNQISEGLIALAKGNLHHQVNVAVDNELYDLAQGFNSSLEQLRKVFRLVGDVAKGLETSAREIQSRSAHTSENALRNAATFEETSAEVDMIAGSINNAAQSADDATSKTKEAARLADVGAVSMAQALEATTDMRKATDEMSGINEVIDSIAFQTNLLALNAGIEAARAGQSGAGFAVVATEIRNLAGRSQDASSQIQTLIARSVEQAKITENHVHESESNLKQVQSKSRSVADSMTQISHEAGEQASRVALINQTIRELAVSGERDAQLASEHEDAAEVLSDFSNKLSAELKLFDRV